MTRIRRSAALCFAVVAASGIALVWASPGPAGATTTGTPFTFTNFEPAGLSTLGINEGGGTVGTSCPGAGASKCWNIAAEPAIRADGAGNFYATSENGLGTGTEAWKSTDGGRHYVTLPSPDATSQTNTTGFAPGGGDTDLAVGDDANKAGVYPVHVATLSLLNVDVANSQDGGQTFTLDPKAATISGDDREWIAADDSHQSPLGLPLEGGDKVCISYHDVETYNINVDCSYDGGTTFTQHAVPGAIDTSHAFLIDNNEIGNLAIARDTYEGDGTNGNHNIYQVFSGPQDLAGTTACGTAGTCYNAVWIAVSKDGGQTFTDHLVHAASNINTSYGHQFVNVSVDRKGNIYVVYTDDHNMYYSYSRNQGTTWHGPYRINVSPANTAIFPWSVAGDAGKIDVVYYGTSYYKSGTPPDSYPNSAAWHVYMAQNTNVFGDPTGFVQQAASPINHYGGVCEGGVSCTGNRDLYDDFGVAASPITGLASIVYSDDQYRSNNANNPNSPSCTAATTNTGSCDHTAFATQLSGPGLY
jgi:hypothetical protein